MPLVRDAQTLLACSDSIAHAMDACTSFFKTLRACKLGYIKGMVNMSGEDNRELGPRHYTSMGYGDGDALTSQLVAALRESATNSLDAGASKVTVVVKALADSEYLMMVLDNAPHSGCLSQAKFEAVQTVQFASEKPKGAVGGKACGGTLPRTVGNGYLLAGADGFRGSIGAQFAVSTSGDSLFTLDAVRDSVDPVLVASREATLAALQAAPSVEGAGGLVAIRFTYRKPIATLLAPMAYWIAQCAGNFELVCDSAEVPEFTYAPDVLKTHEFCHTITEGRAVHVSLRVIRQDTKSPVRPETDSCGIRVWVSNAGVPMFVTTVWPNRMANTDRLQLLVSLHVESPTDAFKDCDLFNTHRTNLRSDAIGGLSIDRIVEVAVREFEALLDKPTGKVVEGKISGAKKFDAVINGKTRAMRKVAELLCLTKESSEDTAAEDAKQQAKLAGACKEMSLQLSKALESAIASSSNPEALKQALAEFKSQHAGPRNPNASELMSESVRVLYKAQELLEAEGATSGAAAARATAKEMEATRQAEMRITTERDGSDATIVRESVDAPLKGLVEMPRQDETGNNLLPGWRDVAIVQLAEAIGVVAANKMGYDAPPDFGVLFKSPQSGLITLGMYTRELIFINAPYFVQQFSTCSTYAEARVVLSSLRETTLHEMTHHYRHSSSDFHDRQFWDFMCRTSNDCDVCDGINELFAALGCTGRRARLSDGDYMLNLITRVFNPKYKPPTTKRAPKAAAKSDSDGDDSDDAEEEEREREETPNMFDEIIDLTHSSDDEEAGPSTKREREEKDDDEEKDAKSARSG